MRDGYCIGQWPRMWKQTDVLVRTHVNPVGAGEGGRFAGPVSSSGAMACPDEAISYV